jgi:hypothetical protein
MIAPFVYPTKIPTASWYSAGLFTMWLSVALRMQKTRRSTPVLVAVEGSSLAAAVQFIPGKPIGKERHLKT